MGLDRVVGDRMRRRRFRDSGDRTLIWKPETICAVAFITFEQAVEYALAITATAAPAASAAHAAPAGDPAAARLTAREREVATLIVQGRTNREIAEALVLSERTADSHVRNIMGKLEVGSRAQIAVWAVEHGLGTPRHHAPVIGRMPR